MQTNSLFYTITFYIFLLNLASCQFKTDKKIQYYPRPESISLCDDTGNWINTITINYFKKNGVFSSLIKSKKFNKREFSILFLFDHYSLTLNEVDLRYDFEIILNGSNKFKKSRISEIQFQEFGSGHDKHFELVHLKNNDIEYSFPNCSIEVCNIFGTP